MNQDTGSHADVAWRYVRVERRILVAGEQAYSRKMLRKKQKKQWKWAPK